MVVLVYERNLLWSTRLASALRALGHEAVVIGNHEPQSGDAAIINLGDSEASDLITGLRVLGVKTLGHAGHKEKDLHELGKAAGCDVLATNSEITHKLAELLQKLA